MSLHQSVTGILQDATAAVLAKVQEAAENVKPGWVSVIDEDGNYDCPNNERQVLVFLLGDRKATDARPSNAGHGLRLGWFDTEKRHWRVNGINERYVTHWRECPADPELP